MKKKYFFSLAVSLVLCVSLVSNCVTFAAAPTGKTIHDSTRYTDVAVGANIDAILELLLAIASGMPDTDIVDFATNTQQKMHDMILPYIESQQKLVDYANASTSGEYTIETNYTFIGKRQLVYPYNNMSETDYMICYYDENEHNYSPQQFGAYTITPNSILFIRDTNFDGVRACSIPLELNGLKCYVDRDSSLLAINYTGNSDNTFIYDTADGTQTVGCRHLGSDFRPLYLDIKNNDYNTIRDNRLIDYYTNDFSNYITFIPDGEPLTDLEAFFGTGYNENMSSGWLSGFAPYYMTTGVFSIPYNYLNGFMNNTNNNITTNVINPKNPPVYVTPNTSPFAQGNTLNQNTVNNYNDYGITYNTNTNEFELDLNALVAGLAGALIPELQGLFEGVFALQPSIDGQFGVEEPSFNLIQIMNDWLREIEVVPQTPWEPPTYPAFNEEPLITAVIPSYTLPTIPSDMGDSMGDSLSWGWSMFDSLGLLPYLIPCIFIIVFWRFTGK